MTDADHNAGTDHYCHLSDCTKDGELEMYLPEWEERRTVCRGFLQFLQGGVDAKTWIEAGYATWKPNNRDLPIPIDELRDGERIRKREILDETMGWAE